MPRRILPACLALSACFISNLPVRAIVAYTTLNLGSIQPGATIDGSAPLVVNGTLVAGSYLPSGATTDQPFVYNIATGLFTALAPPGSSGGSCQAISDGLVVGNATHAGATFGFLYNPGNASFTCLQPPGSSASTALAVSGSTVAGSEMSGSSSGTFLYNIGTRSYATLAPPAGFSDLRVTGISNSSPAGSYTDASGVVHGFIDNAGIFTTIDPAGSTGTHIAAVDTNLIAGSYTDSSNVSHGFLYNSALGFFVRIDPAGSKATTCTAVSGNTVAGTYEDSAGVRHGFIYTGNNSSYTTLAPPGATASTCTGISGDFAAGTFTDGSGQTRAFVASLAGPIIVGGNALVTLSGLELTYNGSPQAATVTTNPAGLPVTVTYSSPAYPASTTPPTRAGAYGVVAVVNPSSFTGSARGTLVINKALATLVLGNLTATYNGSGQAVTVTTTPPGLAVSVTYDGNSTLPVNAGSHAVMATIVDPNYQDSTLGTLTINRVAAVVTLTPSSLSAVYSHAPAAASATTLPAGLPLAFTYRVNGTTTTPLNAGAYSVTATVLSPNATGSATGTLVVSPAPATVTLGNLNQPFTGQPIRVTATTLPPGLLVGYSYNGVPNMAPAAVGRYTVVGTVPGPNYAGSGTATLVVAPPQSFAATAAEPLREASGAWVDLGVNPGGVTTTAYFIYSTDPTFATFARTANEYVGNPRSPVMVRAFLGQLQPSTTYYYELVTVSAAGTFTSSVQSFTTLGFATTLVAATGTPAPGTSLNFAMLGNAAVDAQDGVAFQATLGGAGATTANNAGIWANQGSAALRFVAQAGAVAPGTGGAIFAMMSDPVYDNQEDTAFGGMLKVAPGLVTPSTASGVWASSGGTLGLVARQGSVAPGTGGARFAVFNALGLSENGGAIVSATLTDNAAQGVTNASNAGVWEGTTSNNLTLMLRNGEQTDSGRTLVSFRFLPAETCVNGQTRGFGPVTGHLVANVTYADRSTGIVKVLAPASPVAVATSGDSAAGTIGATFAAFSSASINDSDHVAFSATLTPNVGDVTGANAGGVWADDSTGTRQLIARLGQVAPGTETNATFTSFSDPVDNDNDVVAFRATLSGGSGPATTATASGLWCNGTGPLALVAQQGGAAPGCPAGVAFASFTELALANVGGATNSGGLIFLATLTGPDVTAANNAGIFAVDATGTLCLIVRTGDVLNGKTISSLAFLPAETLVSGQARSFSPLTSDLVYNARFTDGSQAIFNVVFP